MRTGAAARRRAALIDMALVVVAVIAVLVFSPGLAVVAIIAIAVLLVCAISLGVGRLRRDRTARRPRRPSSR